MKTSEIIANIAKTGTVKEREVLLLKRRANAGADLSALYEIAEEIKLTPEQSSKGFAWLWNLYKSPAGKERKNNPFACREINILENYKGENFTFRGFYDAGNRCVKFNVPIYGVGGMEYVVYGGQIHIIG